MLCQPQTSTLKLKALEGGNDAAKSLKQGSYKSARTVSVKSKVSVQSMRRIKELLETLRQPAVPSEQDEAQGLMEELAKTLEICNVCSGALSSDEKVINARFI